MTNIMKIAIYGNDHQDNYLDLIDAFLASLAHYDVQIAMEASFYEHLCRILPIKPHIDEVISGNEFSATIVLSIGGDGTFLRTAQWIGAKGIPILGINTGHLGYLSAVKLDEMDSMFDDLFHERYKIEERALIECDCLGQELPGWHYALNEVAILKQDTSSMISIATKINDKELATYLADGLIIATPTGSTGYNLSVGGPILEPTAPNWVLSPIAAHSLTMRPLVVGDDNLLTITTTSRTTSYRVSCDGHSLSLPIGSTITLRKAPFVTRVIQRLDHSFTNTLRNKLYWGIR